MILFCLHNLITLSIFISSYQYFLQIQKKFAKILNSEFIFVMDKLLSLISSDVEHQQLGTSFLLKVIYPIYIVNYDWTLSMSSTLPVTGKIIQFFGFFSIFYRKF